jgi:hypothetical protein
MIHVLAFLNLFWHPLGECSAVSTNHVVAAHEIARCKSYNWWSGIGADIQEIAWPLTLLLVGWRTYKHLQCDVEAPKNCKRIGHAVPGTGHKACHEHHPHAMKRGGITAEDILKQHEDSGA